MKKFLKRLRYFYVRPFDEIDKIFKEFYIHGEFDIKPLDPYLNQYAKDDEVLLIIDKLIQYYYIEKVLMLDGTIRVFITKHGIGHFKDYKETNII